MKRIKFKLEKGERYFTARLPGKPDCVQLCEEGVREFFTLPRGCKAFDLCVMEPADVDVSDWSYVYVLLPTKDVHGCPRTLYLSKKGDYVELPGMDYTIQGWLWDQAAKDPHFSTVKIWVEA